MGCGCNQKASDLTPDTTNLVRAFPRADNEFGVLTTSGDPYCEEPYTGIYQQATVFVLGFGTEDEKLFRRGDRREAVAYATEKNVTFDQVQARSLCDSVARELLGA